jgi:hypothetical protein
MRVALIRRKSKYWLAENQDNVWQHVYSRTVVSVSLHYKNPTQRVGLAQCRPHHHLIEN